MQNECTINIAENKTHTHTHSNGREREKKMDMQTIQNSDCKQIPFKRTTQNAYDTYVQLI